MTEPRYASLSSGLLARKGAAKPAMRPQAFGHVGPTGLEDLGWNDMGYGEIEPPAEHVPSSIAALTPAPRSGERRFDEPVQFEPAADFEPEAEHEIEAEAALAPAFDEPAAEPEVPPVAAQQRAIAESFGADAEPEAESAPVPAPRRRAKRAQVVALPRRAAVPAGRKAAFTLRLDTERHLRLRLACAVTGRSAQQLVTAALDEALAAIPEIEALAERVPAGAQRS